MIVLNSSKSGRSTHMSGYGRSHSRSYSNLKQSKERAYRMLKRYSAKGKQQNLPGKKGKPSKVKQFIARSFGVLAGLFVVVLIISLVIGASWLAQVSGSLPQPGELIDREVAQSTRIYSKEGQLLYTFYGDENREFVSIDQIPEHTKWALLAAEDIEFYEHEGVDLTGMASAGLSYATGRTSRIRGASTLTQQLVKNTLLKEVLGEEYNDRSVKRKIMEILVTLQVEKQLSKDQILEMYMNEVNMGGVNYGYQAASKAYFNKDVKDLTVAESALLAGIVQLPSTYVTGGQPNELALERKGYVLKNLEKYRERTGITKAELKAAKTEEIKFQRARANIKAPHFVFYVKDDLIAMFGEDMVFKGGLKVTTSLDYDIQKIAEEEVKAMVDRARPRYNTHNGAMVAVNPKTGEIVSMVGSYDYWKENDERVDGKVNITTALRQPGSSVKPITYVAAFESGTSYPAKVMYNIPGINFGYNLKNWDGGYRGLQTARDALANSDNIPAVETFILNGGVDPFISTAEKLGITTFTQRERYGSSITLGAAETKLVEEVGMYAVFANGGKKMPLTSVVKVEKSKTGDVLYEYKPEEHGEQVISEQAAYLLTDVLGDLTVATHRFFPENLRVGDQRLAEKTGTTNSHRDASAYEYYPRLAVVFWSGNNNNEPQIGPRGAGWSTTVPLPAAHSFLSRVIPIVGKESFKRPGGIVSKTVCRKSGLLATQNCKGDTYTDIFAEGKLPPVDNAYKRIQVCTNANRISSNPEYASKFGLLKEVHVVSLTAYKKEWQAGLNSYLAGQGLLGPSETGPCTLPLGNNNSPSVDITAPAAGSTFSAGDSVTVKANIATLNGLSSVKVKFDGNVVLNENASGSSYTGSFNIPNGKGDGAYTIEVIGTDVDGKTGSDSVSINVGSTSVSISLTKPAGATDTGSGSYLLEATVTGQGSCSSINVKFNISSIGNVNASKSGCTYTYTLSGAPGAYTVYAFVSSGGSGTSSTKTVTITP